MSNDSANRDVRLDAAKGLAIILMVFCHAFETYTNDWSTVTGTWYWASIHHFHMALFIFITGYLAYGKLHSGWLKRRTLQLALPFIVWSIVLYYWANFAFSGIGHIYPLRIGLIKNLLYSAWSLDTSGLWFLPFVLALCLLTYLTRGKPWALLVISVSAYVVDQLLLPLTEAVLPHTYWFATIAWFMPFFAGGYLVSQYRDKLRKLSFIKWIALVAFPVSFILGGGLNYHSTAFSWPDYTALIRPEFAYAAYRFWMTALGIGMSFAVAGLLIKLAGVRYLLGYMGRITLGIYCVHGMWRNIGFGEGIVAVITMTVMALLLSSVLIWGLHRFKVTDYLFLGGAQNLVPRHYLSDPMPLPYLKPSM